MDKNGTDIDDFRNQFQAFLDDLYSVESMDGTPVGSIVAFPSVTPPSEKWLFCNGQTVAQADYPELYALIGDIFTFPPDDDNFDVPSLGQKFIYGAANDTQLFFSGGSETHTLTIAQIPAHDHAERSNLGVGALEGIGRRVDAISTTVTTATKTASEGGGGSHNNMPPYVQFAWMIKALP